MEVDKVFSFDKKGGNQKTVFAIFPKVSENRGRFKGNGQKKRAAAGRWQQRKRIDKLSILIHFVNYMRKGVNSQTRMPFRVLMRETMMSLLMCSMPGSG